jgi:release factor glutamine methyltransferase
MMPTIAQYIAQATRRLASISESPRLDAELILAHVLGIPRASLLARLREDLPPAASPRDAAPQPSMSSITSIPAPPHRPDAALPASVFESLIARRERGEPLAYLFGQWEFYSLEFDVTPPALVPRPETEHLVEAVLDFIGGQPAAVLDLCTGTGCVAVAIAVNAPGARLVATDIDPRYAALAARNALKHRVADRVECRAGDLFSAVKHGETFDAICANPPYIEAGLWPSLPPAIRDFEDPGALLAGEDGLDRVRTIARDAPRYLRPGGLLALEVGQGQSGQTASVLAAAGFTGVRFVRDLAGIDRIACGYRRGEPAEDAAKEFGFPARL